MAGDATLFAREDYVEEAWRIVDPVLQGGAPVQQYEPDSWGPAEVSQVAPPQGWQDPVIRPGGGRELDWMRRIRALPKRNVIESGATNERTERESRAQAS